MSGRQRLVVLGATGSVGRCTLDVAARQPERFAIFGLSAQKDAAGLAELCVRHQPRYAVLADPAGVPELRERLLAARLATGIHAGSDALDALAAHTDVDQVMCAIAGSAGLHSTLAAIRAGKRVLIANKEPLVMCGALMLAEARRCQATVLPIDSEHNAIFQCLPAASRCGERLPRAISKLVLTASGGPFRTLPLSALCEVTPEQAVRHPNWQMGRKISVDSATMMNKGLELIEAAMLYGVSSAQIEVVIHPESVVHSLVEYCDGSTLAQLGQPDMRVPIAHALAWPERCTSGVGGLDWQRAMTLHFEPLDADRFPAVALARAALESGGHSPNVLNAANEVAVAAFLTGALRFDRIAGLVETVLEDATDAELPRGLELADALAVADWAKSAATRRLSRH